MKHGDPRSTRHSFPSYYGEQALRRGAFLDTSSPNVDECVITSRAAYKQPTKDSCSHCSRCPSCSRNPRIPATFSNDLTLPSHSARLCEGGNASSPASTEYSELSFV